jgi:MYXO-CTERM domain-containing protein
MVLKKKGGGRIVCAMMTAALMAAGVAAPAEASSTALRNIKWPRRPQAGPLPVEATSTVGWQFRTRLPIEVTHLGFYDLGGDGLERSHKVGIWDEDHNLLATAVVEAGADSSRRGRFRYAQLDTPILLPGGQNFVIGATIGGGDVYPYSHVNWDVLNSHDRVRVKQRSLEGVRDDDVLVPPLTFPTVNHPTGEALAANFRFTPLAAIPGPSLPEPGIAGLAAIAGLGLLRRRR